MDRTVQPSSFTDEAAELPDSHWGGGYVHQRSVRRKMAMITFTVLTLVAGGAAAVAASPVI